MKEIDVYSQYFRAGCVYNGVERKAVMVRLTVISDAGNIEYVAAVSFFPHTADDDFAVSYDAYAEKSMYSAPGRRSRKREEGLLSSFRDEADVLAGELGGQIFWDEPLIEARMG